MLKTRLTVGVSAAHMPASAMWGNDGGLDRFAKNPIPGLDGADQASFTH